MSSMSLWLSFSFVLIALLLSLWQKLGLEKEIAVSTVRCAVQLLVIGYVLQVVFHADHPVYLALVLVMMIAVASWNASRRGDRLPGGVLAHHRRADDNDDGDDGAAPAARFGGTDAAVPDPPLRHDHRQRDAGQRPVSQSHEA